MADPQNTPIASESEESTAAAVYPVDDDDDGPVARFLDIIARLQTLLPMAQQIDAVVLEVTPEKPDGRRSRHDPVDAALYESLKRLPTDLADRIQSAIDNVESDLEHARESAEAEARAELEEAEERVRELRQRLGLAPPVTENDEPTDDGDAP